MLLSQNLNCELLEDFSVMSEMFESIFLLKSKHITNEILLLGKFIDRLIQMLLILANIFMVFFLTDILTIRLVSSWAISI